MEVTGSLHGSIQPVKLDNQEVAIAIINEEASKISFYQEKQVGNIRAGQNAKTGTATPAKIFEFSNEEFEQVQLEANEAVGQVIKKMFDEA